MLTREFEVDRENRRTSPMNAISKNRTMQNNQRGQEYRERFHSLLRFCL